MNGALLEKETHRSEEKALTAGNSFVIKFGFAGQFFATEYEPAGERAGAQVPNKVHDTQSRTDPLDRPSQKKP